MLVFLGMLMFELGFAVVPLDARVHGEVTGQLIWLISAVRIASNVPWSAEKLHVPERLP